ncbi:MAG: DUF1552 domain-containing protein [Deltaproteobacteria bacterium]|nr:DUF1552 domain-containing protein [Deltaproteobacteria bacterium]
MTVGDGRAFGRRLLLRGLGVGLALPLLESLTPRGARAEPPTPIRRVLYYYVPNGFNMNVWADAVATMAGGKLSSLPGLPGFLAPLAGGDGKKDLREKLLVVSGLDNAPANYRASDDDANGAHFQQTASFLSCRHVDRTPFGAGQSIDQSIATSLGYITPHRSLQLGLHGSANGACAAGWPCAYLGFISWADATTPLAQLNAPGEVFETLFSSSAGGVSPADLARRKARKLRVLDVVHADAKSLHGKLGQADRYKLEQYLTAVDEAEVKAQAMGAAAACEVDPLGAVPVSYPERLDLMADLMTLAFKCDLTRVISFMRHSGGASFGKAYDFVLHDGKPLTEQKHTYSHWNAPLASEVGTLEERKAAYLAKLAAINTWEIERLAYLLRRLDDVVEPTGGTLLDNSVVLFGSELGEPDHHLANDLPLVLAGSCGGTIATDRHLAFNGGAMKNDTFADLHLGLAQRLGVTFAPPMGGGPLFGEDGTKPLPGLDG